MKQSPPRHNYVNIQKLPGDVPHTPQRFLSVRCGFSHFVSEFSSSKIMRNNFFVCARNNSKQATEKCFSFKNRNPFPISTFASFYITGSLSTTLHNKKFLVHGNCFFFLCFKPTPCKCCDYLPLLIYANSQDQVS